MAQAINAQLKALSGEQLRSAATKKNAQRPQPAQRTLVRAQADHGSDRVQAAKKAVSLGLTALVASAMPLMAAPVNPALAFGEAGRLGIEARQAAKNTAGQVKDTAEGAINQAQGAFGDAQGAAGQARGLFDKAQGKAESVVGDAKDAASNVGAGNLGDKLKSILPGSLGEAQGKAEKVADDAKDVASNAGNLGDKVKSFLPGNPVDAVAGVNSQRESGVEQGKSDASSGNIFGALKDRVGDVLSNASNPKEAVDKATSGDIGGAVGKVKSDVEAAPGKVANDLGFGQGVASELGSKVGAVGDLGEKVGDIVKDKLPSKDSIFGSDPTTDKAGRPTRSGTPYPMMTIDAGAIDKLNEGASRAGEIASNIGSSDVASNIGDKVKSALPNNAVAGVNSQRESGVEQGKSDASGGNVFSALKDRVGDVASNINNPKEAVSRASQGDIGGAANKVKEDVQAAPGKVANDLGFGQGVAQGAADKAQETVQDATGFSLGGAINSAKDALSKPFTEGSQLSRQGTGDAQIAVERGLDSKGRIGLGEGLGKATNTEAVGLSSPDQDPREQRSSLNAAAGAGADAATVARKAQPDN